MTRLAASLMLATSALALRAPDDAAAAATPAPSPIAEFEFPNLDGKRSFDLTIVPANIRMDFLAAGVRGYIQNRLNSLLTRHNRDPKVVAWFAYDEATKADPLQSAVAKPEGERPAAPDYEAAYAEAVKALQEGKVRKVSQDGPKRKPVDQLTKIVTEVVTREVYDARRAANPKYSFFDAKKEVGTDGVAYLQAKMAEKVAAGADATEMQKVLDTRYLNPAKAMLGQSTDKKLNGLPSLL